MLRPPKSPIYGRQAVCRRSPITAGKHTAPDCPIGGRSATEPDDRAGSCAEKVDGVVPARPFSFLIGQWKVFLRVGS